VCLPIGPEPPTCWRSSLPDYGHRHGGKVPAISRYNPYERVEGPLLPHLFQSFSSRADDVGFDGWRQR
jgi:hypothetical protein